MNKCINKKVSLLVLIVLAICCAFAGIATLRAKAEGDIQMCTVYAPSVEFNYDEDDELYYEVWFEPVHEFTSFSIELEFPEFIEVVKVIPNYRLGADEDGRVGITTGPNAGSYTYDVQNNRASVALSSTEIKYAGAKLFTLELNVLEEDRQSGSVEVKSYQFINSSEITLDVEFDLGGVSVISNSIGKMGDMDGDNDVDLVDLVTVQRSITDLSGQYELTQAQAILADINGDQVIDIIDCQLIREYIVGLIPSLDNYGKPVINKYTITIHYGYGDGGWNEYGEFTVNEGVSILGYIEDFAYENDLPVVESYYDGTRQQQVLGADVLWSDIELYLVLERQETPTEYTFTVYYKNVTHGDEGCAGDYTAPANAYLVEYITSVANESGANVLGVYFDSAFENMIDSDYQITSNLSVWVIVENQEQESTQYVMNVYGSSRNGFVPAGTYEVNQGDSISQIIMLNFEYMMEILDGIYYDAEMTLPVGENDVVSGNVDIYLYSSKMHGSGEENPQEIYIEVYVLGDEGWEYLIQLFVENGANVYDTVQGFFGPQAEYIVGVYYDDSMMNIVSPIDVAMESVSVYVNIRDISESDKEKMLVVELLSEDGQSFDVRQIPVAGLEGQNVLEIISMYFNRQITRAYYVDEFNTQVGEEDVYNEQTSMNIRVVVNKVFVNIMDEELNLMHRFVGYGFDGDNFNIVGHDVANRNGFYAIIDISTSPSFDAEIGEEDLVYNNAEIYVLVNNNGGDQEMRASYWVEIIERANGELSSTGMARGGSVSLGEKLIDLGNQLVPMLGGLYTVIGYYYDIECTQAIPEGALVVEGDNEVYILVELVDIYGEYFVSSMQGDDKGTLTINQDGTATFGNTAGSWDIINGMCYYNYGKYSQNVFMLYPSEENATAMLYSEFNAENFEETDEFKQLAGEYVWREEAMGEIGVEEYRIVLYSNGACEITAMGMTMRQSYSVVAENVVMVSLMGMNQYFNVDKENGEMVMNYFAEYVGEFNLFKHIDYGRQIIGTIEIEFDGSATITYLDETTVSGTAVYNSGSILFYISEFHCMNLGVVGDYGAMEGYVINEVFDGSEFEENPDFSSLVGTYDFLKHEQDDMYTITFYANGVYKSISSYGFTEIGRYALYEDKILLYYYNSFCESIIVFDGNIGAYVRYDGYVELPDEGGDGEEPKYTIPEAWYTRIDDENIQMYFRQDGTVIINEYGNERESFYSYDGKIVQVEGVSYVLDVDNLTMQIKPIIDSPIGGGVVFQ